MFQNISRKYIDFNIRKHTKNNSRKKQFANFRDISSIQILLSANNISQKKVDGIRKMLGDEKQVSVWLFDLRKNALQNTDNVNTLTNKDISILQKPSEKIEKDFLHNEYDLLIDLTTREILPLKYLLGISKAQCRCGMKKKGYPFYDLEIEVPVKIKTTELLKQILHYLNTIKTKS